jgi:hypothetical protein
MSASTLSQFEALVPNAGFSFEDFGNATQGDLDELKNLKFRDDIPNKIKLQGLWARHPNRQGKKRRYIYVITPFFMQNLIAQIIYQ